MSSGPKQHPIQFLAVPVARTVLAGIVTLSFLATVVSLSTTSSAAPGAMACCIGKPGHESGSCSTGLLDTTREPQPESEILCGQQPAQPIALSIKVIDFEAEAEGGHCNPHTQSTGEVPSDSTKQSEPEATSAKSKKSGLPGIQTLSSPCPAKCGTCSVSFTRRPRPREQSTLSSAARPRLHFTRRVIPSDYPQIKTLNTKWMQLRPRAPPARLA